MSAGAAAAAAAIAQAIRASGAIVSVEPNEFMNLLRRQKSPPLVVKSTGGFFSTKHQYLMSYQGLIFHSKSPMPIDLPPSCEIIEARKIWVPG
jgi:hypothetical protein